MGRELQKKKNRSSIPKLRHKQPSKKKVLQNPIIAANWNQKQTLSQNYARLGLTARLNHATGGTEKNMRSLGLNDPKSSRADAASNSTADALNIVSSKPQIAEVEEIQVERDPETGAILRVVDDKTKDNPLNDPLNEILDDDEDIEEWNGFAMVPKERSDNPVIRQLEEAARNGAKKAPRSQSQREIEWLERLVNKYGDDYGSMSRDMKLNPMQQTAADIKKRVKKWNESKGKERKVWT
ncbi:60S ribosomal subunit biogenesis protein-like protein Nop16 [Bimuria novae-zelandiae CBS 107.79]|uniref:Nucleolar protein 16 n=1 Tax=Bimuria novae-zelandiae CBS 107.79 TaxID=1447943 RepID=A0A6A5UXW4_9PLEO|nr:60S ribosomal subunit biogenesis protein-like protein Nop16 [Bimuria novae-zelandiae CBS 107.79]